MLYFIPVRVINRGKYAPSELVYYIDAESSNAATIKALKEAEREKERDPGRLGGCSFIVIAEEKKRVKTERS